MPPPHQKKNYISFWPPFLENTDIAPMFLAVPPTFYVIIYIYFILRVPAKCPSFDRNKHVIAQHRIASHRIAPHRTAPHSIIHISTQSTYKIKT